MAWACDLLEFSQSHNGALYTSSCGQHTIPKRNDSEQGLFISIFWKRLRTNKNDQKRMNQWLKVRVNGRGLMLDCQQRAKLVLSRCSVLYKTCKKL